MNEEYHKSLIKNWCLMREQLSPKRSVYLFGCPKMLRIVNSLEPYEKGEIAEIGIFEICDKKIQFIPSGTARLFCSKETFQRYDNELQSVGQKLRPQILDVCFEIIDKYGDKENRLNL